MKRRTPEPKKSAASRPTAARAGAKHKQRWIRGVDDSDLEKELARRARTNPRTIAPSTGKSSRTPDSGFIFMRPVCDDYDCPGYPDPDDDTPPVDPCAGQNWVWQPDIAVQLNTGEADCPSSADLARIEHGLGSNLSPFHLANPDVRVRCSAGKIYISIWGNRVRPDGGTEGGVGRRLLQTLPYSAIAEDFFGKLVYTWSAGANATIHNQGRQSTKITFKRGNTAPGNSFQRTVKLTVTDPEGSTITVSHNVSIFVNDSPDMSPLCMAKPWLPQCNP